MPSSTPWLTESFDQTPVGSSPAGWMQWSSQPTGSFSVESGRSFAGANGYGSTGSSQLEARSWYGQVMQADFGASAYVYLDSLQPLQLMVRGQNLDTAAPTYYALSVNRGLQASLVKVVGGATTELASLKSATYVSGQWVQITLKPDGSTLSAEIYRPDTQQYLNASGGWQSVETAALSVTDTAIAGNGYAGIERPARYAATSNLDEFSIFGPGVRENFDSTALNTLPAGWAQWSNNGAPTFAVTNQSSNSPANALASTSTSSQTDARVWVNSVLPADMQISASINLTSLVPGRLFARGQNIDSTTPTYYALQVTRGLQVQLLRVVNGVSTSLGTLASSAYFSNQWVNVTLAVSGSHLYAQVRRLDNGQYLNSTGAWQNASARRSI